MKKYHGNTVEYWKQNAEENYLTTPISVLKYITVLEEQVEQINVGDVGRSAFLMPIRWFEKMLCKHRNKTEISRCYQDRYISELCNDCGKVIYNDL
jgi:hypothetical protein